MRAYIYGNLSTKQECFLPSSLWFANNDCEDTFKISENCIRLDGLELEGAADENSFACRWKGVELCHINNNEYEETENFTVEQFSNIIKEKNMRLVNMDAYFDTSVNVTITSFELVDQTSLEFDTNLIDKIEFVADGDCVVFPYASINNGEEKVNIIADNY